MKKNSIRIVGLFMLLLLLSGCGGSDPYQDLKAYMEKVKAQQAKMASSGKLGVSAPASVVYNGHLRRSPFSEEAQLAGSAKPANTNPLQAYSLNMLRLLGTVTEKGATVAYITTPDNMVYRIQVGDIIGDHHGKVVSIQPGMVNVMELDTDNPDAKMQRIVSLKLREET